MRVLRSTVFDRYMLLDDTDAYPMTCFGRFEFDGEVERARFHKTLVYVLAKHPYFSISKLSHGAVDGCEKNRFICAPICLEEIVRWDVKEESELYHAISTNDLRVKFYVKVGEGKSTVVLCFHHAVSDGIAAIEFMEDFFQAYGNLFAGRELPHSVEVVDDHPYRHNFGLKLRAVIARTLIDARRSLRFFVNVASSLKESRPSEIEANAKRFGLEHYTVADSLRYRNHYLRVNRGETFNDFMVCRLMETCLEWNESHLPQNSRSIVRGIRKFFADWIKVYRISIPVSQRDSRIAAMPATNCVSMVFLDRRAREIKQPASLVSSIHREMHQIKTRQEGFTLIRVLRLLERTPFFQTFLRLPLCLTTSGLSNLGKPFRGSMLCQAGSVVAGDLRLKTLELIPPIRDKTLSMFSVNEYANHLQVTLRYDPRRWNAVDGRRFMKMFIQRIIPDEDTVKEST